jgi:hypothetical protein
VPAWGGASVLGVAWGGGLYCTYRRGWW